MSEKILRVGPFAQNVEGWSSEEVARLKEAAEIAFRDWDCVPHGHADDWETELKWHRCIALGVLKLLGVDDLKNYAAEIYCRVPTAIRDAIEQAQQVCSHAELLSQARTEDARIYHAMRVGYHNGLLNAAATSASQQKSVISNQLRRHWVMCARRFALLEYVKKHGPVPPIGEPGKQNPARTKFRQKFLEQSGYNVNVKTFDEDARVICGESR